MSIAISLSPEIEALLREKADRQGEDISLVAAQLLTRILEWEARDSQEAIEGIQHGLNDLEYELPPKFRVGAIHELPVSKGLL